MSIEAKQQLVSVLAQLVMQKFIGLTYREMSQMLKLTPLEETIDGKELLQNDRIKLLTEQIRLKFSLSQEAMEIITTNLRKLELEELEALFKEILKIETVEQLQTWLSAHTPKTRAQN